MRAFMGRASARQATVTARVLEGGTERFEVVPISIDVQLFNGHSTPPKANIWSSSCSGLFVTERSLSNVAVEKPIGEQGGNNSQSDSCAGRKERINVVAKT